MKTLTVQEAALAWAQGKNVEAMRKSLEHWLPIHRPGESGFINSFMASVFNDAEYEFRLAPEPKLRPWQIEDVPIGAITKSKACGGEVLMIIGADTLGVLMPYYPKGISFRDMLDHRLHSIDGGKTWHPCGVLEGEGK
jgi:hypothetical protein